MASAGNKNINAKLVLLGDVGAGKSSLVLRFVKDQFVEFQESTIGAAFFSQTLAVNDATVKFEIWDTAGQERYHSLAPMYYRGAAAAIIVFDITNQVSFERAKKWVQELQAQGNPNMVMALAGNKADLLDARKVSAEEAEIYAQENSLFFMETSAKTATNVKDIFYEIAKRLPRVQPAENPTGVVLPNGPGATAIFVLEDIDTLEGRGQLHELLLRRIEESRIALVIFSEEYTKSKWCLRELEKIADCVEKGKLVAIPIFYMLDPSTVKGLKGEFGDAFWHLKESDATKERWKKALKSIADKMGIVVGKMSNERKIVKTIVGGVKSVLKEIQSEGSQEASVDPSENIDDGTFGIKQRLKELGDKLDLNKIIGCLLLLFFCLPHIAYMSTPLIGKGGAIDRIVENVPKVIEYIPEDKFTEFPTGKFGANPESSSSYAKTNADFLDRTCTNSPMDSKVKPLKIQVFINFRGDQLRKYFISYLADALRKSGINVFIDTKANIGDDLINLFKRIEDSGIAIVVFSSRYTESEWCLNELVKIKERTHHGLLKVLPIFYKVTPGNVKRLKGDFGENFRDKEYMYASDEPKIKQWKEAIVFVSHKFALTFDEKSSEVESAFTETIVKEVMKMLQTISTVESGQSSR